MVVAWRSEESKFVRYTS